MEQNFWQGKRVFITGHTGFRGSWLALTLQKAGAVVFGYALPPAGSPNFFDIENVGQGMTSTFSDIRDIQSLRSALDFAQAEVVFHLAGGGGLKESWGRIPDVFSAQVMGTINLLECLKETATVRSVVIMSSDKVYRKSESGIPYLEDDALAGNEPAAAAKACTEILVQSYLQGVFSPEKYNKHKIAIATARIGAVIGEGDFAPDSLIYQLAQACQVNQDLVLKNPESVRSWMHVSDAVRALMTLGESLVVKGPKISGQWNFGVGDENVASVAEIQSIFKNAFAEIDFEFTAEGVLKGSSFHGSLNSTKAHEQLGWAPVLGYKPVISQSARWYRRYLEA